MGTINRNKIYEELKEGDIQKILEQQYMSSSKYVLYNLYVFNWESDFLLYTHGGYWHEVEIKITLADFKKDFNKTEKHFILQNGYRIAKNNKFIEQGIDVLEYREEKIKMLRPNYFSYCIPITLKDKVLALIPEYAGLYVIVRGKRLDCIKAPKCIHRKKINGNDLNLTDKFYYNYRNYQNQWLSGTAETIKKLKYQINSLKAEYKAATGYEIKDVL